jgi:tripeptide aminopeptidase
MPIESPQTRPRVEALLDRFLRYARIDTESDPSSTTFPSTIKQLDLLRLIENELRVIGCSEVKLDRHGYLTATVPSTLPAGSSAPVVGLLGHVDTSPDITGANVNPQVWKNYAGGPIRLTGDPTQIITAEETPDLNQCIGHDIITSDGTTLLGADDKSGCAAIVTAAAYLLAHPEIRHGKLRLGFTPDEEIGRGTDFFDVKEFGADLAYTLDASSIGEIEFETFCADTAIVEVHGRNVHPGYAKGKMVNGLKLAAEIIRRLPPDRLSPETTEGREGYVHPNSIEGNVELTRIVFIMRDFSRDGLRENEALLQRIVDEVAATEPRARIELKINESYRNMGEILANRMDIVEKAEIAIRRAGVTPFRSLIRGGTDGARLTFVGLPTPNLFAAWQNAHSKREWVSLQAMDLSVETIVQLAQVWAE